MLIELPYIRERAVEYARTWALERNPLFPNFAGIGGDCTNFVSQCLYAGKVPMSGKPASPYPGINSSTTKWYYTEFNQLTSCDELNTSWCRVVDFNKYFTNKAYKYTYKSANSVLYCGHTSHRNNASITTINESTNNFILFDFTH